METLKVGQIVKHPKMKELGIVMNVRRVRPSMFHSIFYWQSWIYGTRFWEHVDFISVRFARGEIEYLMWEWEPVTKEELKTFIEENNLTFWF